MFDAADDDPASLEDGWLVSSSSSDTTIRSTRISTKGWCVKGMDITKGGQQMHGNGQLRRRGACNPLT